MSLLLLLCTVTTQQQQQQQYQLVDMSFATPLCPPTTTETTGGVPPTPNSLSTLLLSNDLLGERLLLSLSPGAEPDFSCYLCRQNPRYCTTPLDPSLVQPALDESGYNLQLLDLDTRLVTTYQLGLGQQTPVDNGVLRGCGATSHRLLITLLLSIQLPTTNQSREFLTLALPGPTTTEGLSCSDDAVLYQQLGISCHQFPFLYPIQYQSQQCLTTTLDLSSPIIQPTAPSNLTYYPPLYWYAALVFGNTSLPPASPLLCQTRYDVMLFSTELYQTQCLLNQSSLVYNLARHWWHALFVQLLALELNTRASGQQNNSLVQYMSATLLDQLERTCETRNRSLADNRSLLMMLDRVQALYTPQLSPPPSVETRALCDSLQQYFATNFPSQERDYFALYLQTLSFLVYPNKVVQNRLVVFVVSLFVFLLLGVMCVGIVAYPLRVTIRSPLKRI